MRFHLTLLAKLYWLLSKSKDAERLLTLKEYNVKLTALKYLVADMTEPTLPQWMAFSTTTFCNLSCPHCYTHGNEQARATFNSQRWPHELLLRLADETLPTALQFCLTLNGEPLATPRLREVITHVKPFGAKLHLTTNGTLLSRDVLPELLPLAARIDISIDGGTKAVVEAIRLGTDFKQLVNRVRVLTRSCELLQGVASPPIRFAVTVMGSNIRDMPHVVRLAKSLGINCVDFYPLFIYYPELTDENVELHAPLYNAYYDLTHEEGRKKGVTVNFLQSKFPDINPDPDFVLNPAKLIAKLSADYYQRVPSPEHYLENEKIEVEAVEIATAVTRAHQEMAPLPLSCDIAPVLRKYQRQLSKATKAPNEKVPWCGELMTKAFISITGGVMPCCMPGVPVFGDVHAGSVSAIWNGATRTSFVRKFLSSSQPECCKSCRNNGAVTYSTLLEQLAPNFPL